MKELKNVINQTKLLIELLEKRKFEEEKIKLIQSLSRNIKKYILNFEKDHDFFDKNITTDNLNGNCMKELILVKKEVMNEGK